MQRAACGTAMPKASRSKPSADITSERGTMTETFELEDAAEGFDPLDPNTEATVRERLKELLREAAGLDRSAHRLLPARP